MNIDLSALKECLEASPEILAAYLFGSAAAGDSVVNDVDILVFLRPDVDKYNTYIELNLRLSKALGIAEDRIDLLFFSLEETDPRILYQAINKGILVKNDDPDMLADRLDNLSRYFLENESMIQRAKRLRRERLESLCAD